MTNPSDPGHPPRPPAPDQPGGPGSPGGPGGPYGPPPQPHQPQPGAVPGPRPPDPGFGPASGPGFAPQDQQQGWTPPPRDPAGKGVAGALFDMNFDQMITTRIVKIIYALSLVLITLGSLLVAGFGLSWLARGATFFGLLFLVASPFMWLFQLLAVRTLMEFVINQFKISEYLRVIKDKD